MLFLLFRDQYFPSKHHHPRVRGQVLTFIIWI